MFFSGNLRPTCRDALKPSATQTWTGRNLTPFYDDYRNGWPVVVYRNGAPWGIPCGFVLFDDGVAWCDDGVLQEDYCSHHPFHQLYGEVTISGPDILCGEYRFAPAPAWDPCIGEAWCADNSKVGDWRATHEKYEDLLRADRNPTGSHRE